MQSNWLSPCIFVLALYILLYISFSLIIINVTHIYLKKFQIMQNIPRKKVKFILYWSLSNILVCMFYNFFCNRAVNESWPRIREQDWKLRLRRWFVTKGISTPQLTRLHTAGFRLQLTLEQPWTAQVHLHLNFSTKCVLQCHMMQDGLTLQMWNHS